MGGIDLNRNFDFNFGNSIGSSNDPSSAMYRGLTAFSEIETANLRDYIVENEFEICLSLHSGIDSIFMPMGALTHYKDPSDENLMNQFALNLSQFLEYEPLNMSQYVSGLFEPWAYKSIQSVKIALCLEVYGNDSALIENLNETTQVNEIKGIWDKFNPAPNRVIKHSNLIFESITKTLMDYHCRKPTETQVIAGYSIGFLILNILGIAYLIKQNMNKPKMG